MIIKNIYVLFYNQIVLCSFKKKSLYNGLYIGYNYVLYYVSKQTFIFQKRNLF